MNEYTGFNDHRLQRGDEYYSQEVKLHDIANEERWKRQWDLIIFGPSNDFFPSSPKEYLSDKEKRIVGGLLQWLGTPVGESFLRDAGYERIKERTN